VKNSESKNATIAIAMSFAATVLSFYALIASHPIQASYTPTAAITGITNTQIDAAAAIADTKLAQITTASKVSTTAITGTLGADHGGTGTATLTLNNVLLGNGTSAVQFVAPGTSGNVLTSNGTTWSSTAAVGGITTIASGNLSSTAITITSIPATYSYLVLQITNGSHDNASARQPIVRVSTDNGSNYDSTVGSYTGHKVTSTTWGTLATAGLASLTDGATNTAAQTFGATIVIEAYHGGPNMRWHARMINNTTEHQDFGTYVGSTSAINAIQIALSGAGNFDAGTYALYGIK
jgi:hypothetical protein